MPLKEYKVYVEDIIYIQVTFVTEKGKVKYYIVKLILIQDNIKYEIARFDSFHDRAHIDILNPDRTVNRKIWLYSITNEDALTNAIIELKKNYEIYVERFLKWQEKKEK
jgi:hypothetical protein